MRTLFQRVTQSRFQYKSIDGKEVQIIEPRRASGGFRSSGRAWFIKNNDQIFMIIGYAGRFNVYNFNEEVANAPKSFSTVVGMEHHKVGEFKQLNMAIKSVA